MRLLFLVFIYLLTMATVALARPRMPPHVHDLEVDKVSEHHLGSLPSHRDNTKHRSKRSKMHIQEYEDVSTDFHRDFRMGHDASGEMQAHYGYYAKRDNGYPFGVDYELKKKLAEEGYELRRRAQYKVERDDEELGEEDCCDGFRLTEDGLLRKRCECHPSQAEARAEGAIMNLSEDRCAEQIYNEYRAKNPMPTPGTNKASQDEESDLELQKTYEEYYQGLQSECFRQKRFDDLDIEISEGNIFETSEGQIHENGEPLFEAEDAVYEGVEGQLHRVGRRSEEKMGNSVGADAGEVSMDELDLDASMRQKEPGYVSVAVPVAVPVAAPVAIAPVAVPVAVPVAAPIIVVPLTEYVCTTNKLSPLSVDVFRIGEYFNGQYSDNICGVGPLKVNRCTRIGGIRSASIAVCDHYFGWQAECEEVGKVIFELIRVCEKVVDGHYKVSGKVVREGWGGVVVVYRLV